MPRPNTYALLLTSMVLGACRHEQSIWRAADTAVTLGPIPTVFHAEKPFAAPGPTHELCLKFAIDDLNVLSEVVELPDGTRISLRAVLIAADGRRDVLGGWTGRASMIQYHSGEPCLWDHMGAGLKREFESVPGRTYVAVELAATQSLPIREVRWWSGERRILLP